MAVAPDQADLPEFTLRAAAANMLFGLVFGAMLYRAGRRAAA
jgi:hypothetical protein